MNKLGGLVVAAVMGLGLVAAPALAQEHGAAIERQQWTFGGIFGKFDEAQLQRGFQVFREVCSGCHTARLLAFRNLGEPGGPGFTESQVKALAAEFDVVDPSAEGGVRKGIPSDRWPGPDAATLAGMKDTFGLVPPDLSVMAKARSIPSPFPQWFFNYFTTYSEGGPDYIHALLVGYHEEVPPGTENADGTPYVLPEGKYFNSVFPGHAIGMPPPLVSDGQVTYAAPEEGAPDVPETVDQYSRDVSAFLMWVADPHVTARKEAGFRVILFLALFAVLMYFTTKRLWRGKH